MKLEIIWHAAAEHQLKSLGWHPSESVDAAVIRFAETGRGNVERLPPYHRLSVGAYRVRFIVDLTAGTLSVLAVYRAR